MKLRAWLLIVVFLTSPSFAQTKPAAPGSKAKSAQPKTLIKLPKARPGVPNAAEAQAFMNEAEKRLLDLVIKAGRASWVKSTFITDDTEIMEANANEQLTAAVSELAVQSKRFEGLQLPPELARKFTLLKLSLAAPAPSDPKLREELVTLGSKLEGAYGRGKYCMQTTPPEGIELPADKCVGVTELGEVIRLSNDPQVLLDAWTGWHKISPPMRPQYARFAELANMGAKEMGFKDAGAMWRSNYDMPPEQFAQELERLWQQMKPLYLSLHAYVRAKLSEKYGPQVVPPDGLIPAHLLGNMWAQEWGNLYPLVAPPTQAPRYSTGNLLKQKKVDELGMVRYGEAFFTSLGFAPLPKTFWERSLFKQPRDRDVVCHASAWDIDAREDLRLKMCIQINDEDFVTVHHELGHDFYSRAYMNQPPLFQNSANDGFHEALGDAVALSITPEYLVKIGVLAQAPPGDDIPFLLRQALDKVAFLPFGLLIDQWRWKVFSGEVTPANYNAAWWELRNRYQGVSAPGLRTEADFDPGAKYHVPANYPYTRYFLAAILQFQFHRAMCREAGFKGPLYRCSVYDSKAAGARLRKMMEMGASRPWPDALEALTGERQMDAGAMLEYFAPLKDWLDKQNAGKKIGW